jgi:hypothetical protein
LTPGEKTMRAATASRKTTVLAVEMTTSRRREPRRSVSSLAMVAPDTG